MSKFKKKFGRRILAFVLSGAMIMSNMTAFASETSQNTGGGTLLKKQRMLTLTIWIMWKK